MKIRSCVYVFVLFLCLCHPFTGIHDPIFTNDSWRPPLSIEFHMDSLFQLKECKTILHSCDKKRKACTLKMLKTFLELFLFLAIPRRHEVVLT